MSAVWEAELSFEAIHLKNDCSHNALASIQDAGLWGSNPLGASFFLTFREN